MTQVPVFVLAGQSNAEKGGIDNRIVELLRQDGGAFEFAKSALGGTSLFANGGQDWDPASHELYDAMIADANTAAHNVRQQGYDPSFVMLWVQGEADVNQSADAYARHLTDLIAAFRHDVGDPNARFVISSLPFDSTVRTAQFQVAATVPNVTIIDTAGAGTYDGAHYDRATRLNIAERFVSQTHVDLPDLAGYKSALAPTIETITATNVSVFTALYDDATYTGDDRDHYVRSYNGDDRIVTGNGNDNIGTLGGDDYVLAGGGNDFVDVSDHDDTVLGGAGNDAVLGGYGSDLLYGEDGADTLIAGGQDDRIFGGAGNDLLLGEDGNDTIDGGTGQDLASYETATAAVTVDLSRTDAQATGGAGTDTLAGVEDLLGSAFADRLTGDAGANVIMGGAGADDLAGGAGNDHIYGNLAAGAQGAADGGDTISTGGGTNYVNGNAGDDVITVDGDANRIAGGAGNDRIEIVGHGVNRVNGNAGDDQVTAYDGDNAINGGRGDDMLRMLAGNNVVSGDLGNDTIASGTGVDVMTGGDGRDLFSFAANTAPATRAGALAGYYDEITDFTRGTDMIFIAGREGAGVLHADRMTFASVGAASSYAQSLLAHAAGGAIAALQVGADTFLFYNASGWATTIDAAIKLDGVQAAQLQTADFIG